MPRSIANPKEIEDDSHAAAAVRALRLLGLPVLAVLAGAALLACTFTSSSGGRSSQLGTYGNETGGGHDEPRQPAPRVVQLYSPPLYRAFVSRSVPYRAIADQTRDAAIKSLLRVREVDTVFDDHYERSGTIVMLGVEDNALVGFTTRYSVDILYPDDDLISDFSGRPDFAERELTISPSKTRCARRGRRWCTLRYALVPAPNGPLRFPQSSTAYYRTFGDNDAVLVYFPQYLAERLPEADIKPLDIDRPSLEIARILSQATEVLGEDFVLISPRSLQLLRQKAGTKSVLATYAPEVLSWAAGMFGAGRVVKALMSKGASYFAMDRRKLHAAITFKLAVEIAAQVLMRDFDFYRSTSPASDGQTYLPLLHLAEVPYENIQYAASFMHEIVGDAHVEMVLFGKDARTARHGMLFVPDRHVNLNYELVRSGIARLPTDETSLAALRLFPEFAEAASEALDEGAGWAAQWRTDPEYVGAINRVLRR